MAKIEELQDSMGRILEKAVEKGRDMVIKTLRKRIKSGRDDQGSSFGLYSRSHKSRRKKEGLQTAYKDFHYTGTMFDNFDEINREVTDRSAVIQISFKGAPHRRDDQKPHHKWEPKTNLDLAKLITKQQGKKIIGLSQSEKNDIIKAVSDAFKGEIENITIS